MIGEIKTLHPVFRMVVDQILRDMKSRGWDAVIGSGMRTHAQQAAIYAQGRKGLGEVNAMRRGSGLPPIGEADNRATVSDARPGESKHNLTTSLLRYDRSSIDIVNGYAVDIVDRRDGWDIPKHRFWTDLGHFAKKYGCEWGGDWKKPDYAHVQMRIVDSAPRTLMTV